MTRAEIGKRVSELRTLHNYSREMLAEKAGISSKFLYEVEMGRKGLSADSLLKISKTLSCSCDYILTGETPEQQPYDKAVHLLGGFEEKDMALVIKILALMREMCED